jgi:multidrug efflux pump subunit AcrB|tara:strand:- start:173 stop:421 length:249 start_codon:yes stop_codon:yes gene_type:complete
LLRDSNERIAKEQIDAINNSRPQSYNNQTGSVDSIFGGILGVILVFSIITWFFSDMGFWESVVAVVTIPLVIISTVVTNLIN